MVKKSGNRLVTNNRELTMEGFSQSILKEARRIMDKHKIPKVQQDPLIMLHLAQMLHTFFNGAMEVKQ